MHSALTSYILKFTRQPGEQLDIVWRYSGLKIEGFKRKVTFPGLHELQLVSYIIKSLNQSSITCLSYGMSQQKEQPVTLKFQVDSQIQGF